MTVRVYYSTDSGAPVLTDANGSFISLLKACLVNGYGAKAAAGWTNPYNNGGNTAVFRTPAGTNQRYLRVFENGYHGTYGYRVAWCRGYEVMTAHSTGTGLFPTNAQSTTNGHPVKIGASSGGPYINDWMVVATDKMFHVFINTGSSSTVPDDYAGYMSFGDFLSYKSGDAYNTVLRSACEALSGAPYNGLTLEQNVTGDGSNTMHMARNYLQTGGSVRVTLLSVPENGANVMGYGSLPYPNKPDNGLVMAPLRICNPDYTGSVNYYLAGVLPGLWNICHQTPVAHKDTWNGMAGTPLAGKTFTGWRTIGSGMYCVETSDTW